MTGDKLPRPVRVSASVDSQAGGLAVMAAKAHPPGHNGERSGGPRVATGHRWRQDFVMPASARIKSGSAALPASPTSSPSSTPASPTAPARPACAAGRRRGRARARAAACGRARHELLVLDVGLCQVPSHGDAPTALEPGSPASTPHHRHAAMRKGRQRRPWCRQVATLACPAHAADTGRRRGFPWLR